MKKYFAIFAIALLALVGCKGRNNNGPAGASDIDGQWHIVQWNGETPEFDVYVEFKDGKFNIYQQVYSLYYEKYDGSFNVNGDIVTGTYTDGSNWACGYKFAVSGNQLTMYSQEDISVTSVYEKCQIPQAIIDEATTTRSAEAVPFL